MYQVIGKIVYNKNIAGLMVYDYDRKSVFRATLKDCVAEVKNGNMSNLAIVGNKLDVTDGSISKLPIYDVNGKSVGENLPVILERVTNNGDIVGYTLITKEGYKKCKTADLIKGYNEFYNAKVVTKDGTTFLSAKRGTFKELELNNVNSKPKIDTSKYVCIPDDYVTNVKDGKKVLLKYVGKKRKIMIPEGIDVIGSNAFENIIGLEEVYIPDGVTVIDAYAFYKRSDLKKIIISDTVISIGDYAFNNCNGLVTVDIGDNVRTIGKEAFSDCKSLTTVNFGARVEVIADYAFYHCPKLNNVVLTDSVRSVGVGAFQWCDNLKSLTMGINVEQIGNCFCYSDNVSILWNDCNRNFVNDNGVLYSKDKHGLIVALSNCPDEINIPDGVEYIAGGAFKTKNNITKVTMTDSVKKIGRGAFKGCENLKSIRLSENVTVIPRDCFCDCSSLNVVLGDNVEEIGEFAYYGCWAIEELIIPKGVQKIGESAFERCGRLTFIDLPATVTDIGDHAFRECEYLERARIPRSANVGHRVFWNCTHVDWQGHNDAYLDLYDDPQMNGKIGNRYDDSFYIRFIGGPHHSYA